MNNEYLAIAERKLMSETMVGFMQRRYPSMDYKKALKVIGFCRYYLAKEEGREMFSRVKYSEWGRCEIKEAQIQTLLAKKHTLFGCFELKLCKTKSIRFDSVKPHQVKGLLNAKKKGLYHKLSDFPMFAGSKTRFNHRKPWDFFYLKGVPAYVAICFYTPRVEKIVYYIDIEDWIFASEMSDKKSITQSEVEGLCSHILPL